MGTLGRERGVQWTVIEVGDSSPELCGRGKLETVVTALQCGQTVTEQRGGQRCECGRGVHCMCVREGERERSFALSLMG